MSESYKKLIKTLQTIFEMDKADLDFGIYRIMNQKRDDINKFLEDDLLPQVKQAFDLCIINWVVLLFLGKV